VALPNLRELHIRVGSFSSAPLRLFEEMHAAGRSLAAMKIYACAGLCHTRCVQFTILPDSIDRIRVQITEQSEGLREDDVRTLSDGFSLTPYLVHERPA
jgi:hypothetical protein